MKLGLRAYCRHRREHGWSPASLAQIQELVKRGLVLRDAEGLIDVHASDLAIKAWQAARRPPDAGQAKLERAVWTARLARQRAEEAAGILVPAADVRAELFRRARQVRDQLLSIPRRTAGRIATESDAEAIRELIESEFTAALAGLDAPLKSARGNAPARPAGSAAPGGPAGVESHPGAPAPSPATAGGGVAPGSRRAVPTVPRGAGRTKPGRKEKTDGPRR